MARQKNDGKGRMGGRQKGTPNKTTTNVRQHLANAWQKYVESGMFEADMDALTAHDRALLMEKYANYLAPKQKSVDVDMSVQEIPETIDQRLARLAMEDDENE